MVDEKRMETHFQSLLKQSLNSMDSDGEDVKDIAHKAPSSGQNPTGPMKTGLMNFTQMLEAMDQVAQSMEVQNGDLSSECVGDCPSGDGCCDDKDLLKELNDIFTPVLVMQGFEKDISDQANAELSEAAVLTERNIISFDEPARMSQLIATCALLIAKKKNTEQWQLFKKAAAIKKQAKLDIQKTEYNDAQALAQKYLVMVSTTNNSSVARDAANDLLPQTQH